MTAKTTITDQQRNRIKELLEKLPTIDQATIAKACDEFEKWVAAELILKNDPIYLNMLMVVAHQYALKNNPDKAIEFLKIILAQAHKEGNLPMMIRARNNKALVYTSLGKHFEALRQWEELLKMNIPASSRITLLTNMGVTYGKTGQFQKAIKSHFQALELVHEEEQSEVQGDVYINLGNVFRTSGEKQRAIEYYTKAVDIYELSSNKQKLSLAYNNLCGVYNEIEDFEMAERFGCQALELYRIFQHPRELSLVLNNVGATREQQGKYTEAFELYNEALDVASKFNDISMQINILNNLTLLFTEQKSHERAVEYALKTIPLLEEPYHLESAKVTYSLLASAYKELGDLEKAYQSLEKSVEIFSKVADNNPKLFVAREETEFFRHKLEDQLEIYRRQNLELAESNRIISEKTNALETNNNLLIATNVLLNRVISILAHDLRGPVSSIYQTLDLFKEGVFSDSEKEELIEQLNQSSKTTYRLINELLSLAQKYKTGGEDDPALIDVNHEIQDCISLTYTVARPKQIKLIYHPNPNLPQIKLIRSRFRLILRNLLANAVKFSHPGSEVLASIQDLGDIFQLQIMDQGIGMNPTQIDHILAGSSFTQTGTQEEKGFGLGLVFVLESILQTNGKLDIASSPGKGSCFTISWDKSLLM